jgi:hypothetical protein
MRILFYIIACESLVQLWFRALPLQGLRWFIIKKTPWLRAGGEHLFECKYCTSFWFGLALMLGFLSGNVYIDAFVIALSLHRLSNFLHLVFSYIFDKQLNLRISRRKDGDV